MWFQLSNGNSLGCKLKYRWDMRPTYTTGYYIKHFRVTRKISRLQIWPRVSLFFLCVESMQVLEGRSALWHNAQMVTFRQGVLQRLKAEPPSPHLLPSNLAGARINTKEGKQPQPMRTASMQHPCTLLDDRWPCSGADTTPLPCKSTYTGLKTNQTLASTVLQCNKKHLPQPLGASVPVLRPWDGPAPPEATRKMSVAAGSDRRHAPCWVQHKQLWERCCWGRWAGMPDLMIYLCLF